MYKIKPKNIGALEIVTDVRVYIKRHVSFYSLPTLERYCTLRGFPVPTVFYYMTKIWSN